jgi:heavy metal sensor kinase
VTSHPSLVRLLVLWQALALTVSLVVLSVSLFLMAAYRLRSHHDDDLATGCREAGEMIVQFDEFDHGGEEHLREHIDDLGLSATVTALEMTSPAPAEELGVISLSNETAPEHHEGGGSTILRVASGVFQARNGQAYRVQVSENLGDVSTTLRSLQLVILTFAPLVLALSIGVGAWIIHNTLRPLRAVVRAAGSMDVNQLNDRISLAGGSREVTQLVDSFNQMIERLALSFERVREFNANASHELRTPLTALTSSLEVGLDKKRSVDEYREVMQQALLDVRHLNRIVENVLVMSQTDTGQVRLATRRVDLGELLADSIEAVLIRRADSQVDVEVDADSTCVVEGDPHWLRQLFDNLVDNAVKYTPAGGRVRIRTAAKGDLVEVEVADDGVGIPDEELPHVFDRYRRAPSAIRDDTPGVGLGLSIAEWVAGAHHGRIEIESTVGRGSRFTVVLPARR